MANKQVKKYFKFICVLLLHNVLINIYFAFVLVNCSELRAKIFKQMKHFNRLFCSLNNPETLPKMFNFYNLVKQSKQIFLM